MDMWPLHALSHVDAAFFGRLVFAQTRAISMADQLKFGPGYVTGNESTMEEHAVYDDEQDASLGSALYSHTNAASAAFGDVPQHTPSGQDEGSFMGSSSLFSRTAPAPATPAAAASGGPAGLLIDLGDGAEDTNTSGYMEIQPVSSSNPSGANSSDLLLGPLDPLADVNNTSGGYMTVEPPQGPLIDGKRDGGRKRNIACLCAWQGKGGGGRG